MGLFNATPKNVGSQKSWEATNPRSFMAQNCNSQGSQSGKSGMPRRETDFKP